SLLGMGQKPSQQFGSSRRKKMRPSYDDLICKKRSASGSVRQSEKIPRTIEILHGGEKWDRHEKDMGSLTKVDLEVEASSNVDLLREVVAAWEDIVTHTQHRGRS
ncbi:MAG: hypothetical protein ABF333_11415, partial [Akkermansiaceae bacterium]